MNLRQPPESETSREMIDIEGKRNEAVRAIEHLQDRALQIIRGALADEQLRLLPPRIGAVPVPDLNFYD